MPELGGDDDPDWVNVMHPEEWSLQDHSPGPRSGCTSPASETESSMEQGDNPLKIDITHTIEVSTMTGTTEGDTMLSTIAPLSGFRKDQYTLIRLSEVEDRKILEALDTQIGTLNQVLHIEELSDGSWEICILRSHCRAVQDTLGKVFPDSDVDLKYNPFEPTANDLKIWDYDTAKKLRRLWFLPRAVRIVQKGWPAAAAAYYAYILEVDCQFKLSISGQDATSPLAGTFTLQDKDKKIKAGPWVKTVYEQLVTDLETETDVD